MAGFVASGLLRGDHPQLDVEAVLEQAADSGGRFYLMWRTAQEYSNGSLPARSTSRRLNCAIAWANFPKIAHRRLLSGRHAAGTFATRILLQHGYNTATSAAGIRDVLLYYPTR